MGVQLIFTSTRICTGLVYTAQTTVHFTCVYHCEEKVWLQFHTICCKFLLSPFVIERLQRHPGKSGGHVFWCLQSVTECFQSVTDYLQPVTELGTPKNMAAALPGMTLQPLYSLPTGVQNLSTWSKRYVEVDAFVEKWLFVGSGGEKTRPCDFGYKK